MRVAMIGQKGIATNGGGIEKHVEEIALRLVQKGYEVTVYYRNTYMDSQITEYKGIKLKCIKTIKNKNLDAIVYTFKATIDALRGNFDIYHYHALGPASLSFIPRLFRKKVIVTVHGLDWQRGKWGKFAKAYLKFGEYITGKFGNKIISVSENLRDYFIKKYNRKKEDIVFIPNGVDIFKRQPADLIKAFGLEKDNYILYLARIVPEKGCHYLIEAFNNLDTDKKLVMAGGTSFTEDYLLNIKALVKDDTRVIFTGNVRGRLKEELFSNCYIYVLPSDIEGMPLTLLEAMSYRRCCVVSDIPENRNVIKNNGLTFIRGNVDDLREKIEFLLGNEDLIKSMGENAFQDIKNNYDWEQVIDKIEEVYKEVCGGIK